MRWLAILSMVLPMAALAEVKESHLTYPADLTQDARNAAAGRKPLLFLFSVDGCSYCETIRQQHLLPLSRTASSPVIREIRIGEQRRFVDFDGKQTSHAEFARRYNARWAPTVIIMDYKGRRITDPLVGGDTSGLYGGLLEKALDEANLKTSRLH